MKERLRELGRRVQLMVARCVLAAIDDKAGLQGVQIRLLADEVKGGVDRLQPYGLSTHPHPGAEGVCLFLGGGRDHGVVVVVDDRRYRLSGLAPGEVALYDDQGQRIVLHRDRIQVTAPKVVVDSPDIRLGGGGGAAVARVGDLVQVGGGSSAGLWPIVSGSDQVRAE